MPCQTYTGKEFGNIIIAWVKISGGQGYELFLKPIGELIEVGEMQDEVLGLVAFFEKTTHLNTLDGRV